MDDGPNTREQEMVDEVQRIISEGVTITWLAQVFGLNPNTVRSRLAECPKRGRIGKGWAYAVAEAAPYLVKPRIDMSTLLRGLKKSDLPPSLNKDVWDARLKEQRFRLDAKELWRTEDVIELLTGVFMGIKLTVQLWPDTIERQIGLTTEQRNLMIEMCDRFLGELHGDILERIEGKVTPSSLVDLETREDDPI